METILLVIAGGGLLAALSTSRETVLMAAVAVYTGVLVWGMRSDLGLLLPGLGFAIVFGVVAVVRRLRSELAEPDTNGHNCHNAS